MRRPRSAAGALVTASIVLAATQAQVLVLVLASVLVLLCLGVVLPAVWFGDAHRRRDARAVLQQLLQVNVFIGPGSLVPTHPPAAGAGPMAQLGANADGEVLKPGRVPDCYLALRLDPAGHDQAAGVLVVAPAALLHPVVPQPDGTVLYELVTGHPDRAAHELVFLPDVTVELHAWPSGTWTTLGIDPQAAAGAVIAAWHGGHVKGLQLGGLTGEEALALERPAMTYVREQLRQRLAHQVGQAYWRWLHPTSGRRPGDWFL
jgi:hypothetical protein